MKSKKKLFITDWLRMKPYNIHDVVDLEYLKIANKVHREFDNLDFIFDKLQLSDEELKQLAVFLTSYLEDLVSETNIWNTFVKINYREYKKPVPFYNLEPLVDDEYLDEEINFVDIKFLVWYFLNMSNKERFLSPHDQYLNLIATAVFDVLYEEYEFVSSNDKLKKYFELKKNADYYETRSVIMSYLYDSYLLGIDIKEELTTRTNDIMSNEFFHYQDNNTKNRIINEITDKITISNRTYLLAYRGKDWLAEMIRKDHPLFNAISNLSDKICSYFFYIKTEKDYHVFKHLATEKLFQINADSFNAKISNDLNTIYYIEIVKWGKQWFFSGISSQQPFSADLVLDEKNSIESRNDISNIDETDIIENKESLEQQLAHFIGYFGSQIVFTKNEKLNGIINTYIDSFNKSLDNYSATTKEESIKRQREDGFFNHDTNIDIIESDDNIILFFNQNTGFEIYSDIASVLPDSKNPYFTEENEQEIKMILFSNQFSTEFTYFVIENYASKLDFFNNGIGKLYLDDLDFLMRFWKNNKFVSKSTTTTI